MFTKDLCGQSFRHHRCTPVAHTDLVFKSAPASLSATLDPPGQTNTPAASGQARCPSSSPEASSSGVSCLRNSFARFQLPADIADFIMQSWRPGTKKQYETYLRQWLEFCNQRQITYHSPSMRDALGFLMALHNKGLSYSTIGTARSALSNVIVSGECENFGTHSLVSRFMKSVFLQNKPLPKYDCTWDVAVVLKYLETLYPHSDITLKNLTLKLVMIILLVSGQRGQTVHLMDLSSMEMADNTCRFHITEHIKTSKPGASAPIILIKQYPKNAKICPLRTLRDYLSRTNLLRGGASQLFISFQKPYKPVTRQTISRWVNTVMTDAGLDTTRFHPHSTRAASTSKAHKKATPIDVIMSTAGWAKASTFQKFYNKPIIQTDTECDMTEVLLSSV